VSEAFNTPVKTTCFLFFCCIAFEINDKIREKKYASTDEQDPYVFKRDTFLAEPVYNRHLKEIAKEAGVRKQVSNKVARHTNAQLWVRLVAEKPIISKMLGHSKEQTTNVYFRVNLLEVIEGTDHIDFKKLGI
jgi:site-specific recombinase XerD